MRKQLFLWVMMCTVAITLQAQTKEKGLFVETSAAFLNSHYKNAAIFTPAMGYQFNECWSAGMKISLETGNLPWTAYTPFVRFNFIRENKLGIFAEALFSLVDRNVDGGQASYQEAGITFGLTYSLEKHLNLVVHYLFVGYNSKNNREGAWLGNGKFAVDANSQRAQIGLQYLF